MGREKTKLIWIKIKAGKDNNGGVKVVWGGSLLAVAKQVSR